MEERLIDEFGLKKGRVVWNDAWTIKREAPDEATE